MLIEYRAAFERQACETAPRLTRYSRFRFSATRPFSQVDGYRSVLNNHLRNRKKRFFDTTEN